MIDPERAHGWPWPLRVAFRFLFVYFCLSFYSAILQLVPMLGMVGYWYDQQVRPLYVWLGRALFGVEITVFPGGSGDTTYNWVQVAAHLAFAAIAAAVWTAVDWRRTAYPWLRDGLWIAMRFVLASAMFGYGFNKVFRLQFGALETGRMLQTYGESSPMGLLWTFMAASGPYQMAAGWAEVIGGILLCFRHTQLLGALWTAAVMANVFLLNLCYDVPVKLYSFHLLATALVIAAPDLPRLGRLFFLNRPVESGNLQGPWTNPRLRRIACGVKIAWLVTMVSFSVWGNAQYAAMLAPAPAEGSLDGTWRVREFRRDGQEIPPLVTDKTRWRFFSLASPRSPGITWKLGAVSDMTGGNRRWRVVVQDETLVLHDWDAAFGSDLSKAKTAGTLVATQDGDGVLRLSGDFDGARIEAVCDRVQPQEFLLINRGFHWVNERPLNR